MSGSGDSPDARALARVGSVLDEKWALERLIGIGGMASVYAARHRNGARAAIKILDAELAQNEEVRARFLREGYAANRVEHPGVVKVLDDHIVQGGFDDGTAYIVMELLDGEALEDRVQRGPPFDERQVLEILRIVLDVLEAAHAKGVVHRDLKPENLFLQKEGDPRIKVLDFGLARLVRQKSSTVHGLAIGTPSYMAPEQAAGRTEEIDGRTDIFSLGATAFRLLADRKVHEGISPVDIVRKMATVQAPPIQTVAPYVSEPVAKIIDRALQLKREDRYQSAAEMRADVEKTIAAMEAPPPAPAADQTMQVRVSEIEIVRDQKKPKPPPPPTQKKKRSSILPFLAFLVFGGIGFKLYLDNRPPELQRLETSPRLVLPSLPAPAPTPTPAVDAAAPLPTPDAEAPIEDAAVDVTEDALDAEALDAGLVADAEAEAATPHPPPPATTHHPPPPPKPTVRKPPPKRPPRR